MANGIKDLQSGANQFFEMLANDQIQKRKEQSDRRVGILDSLLNLEMQQLNQDRQFLREKGVLLPQADITDNLNSIINLTGNASIETSLSMMLDEAREAKALVDDAYVDFIQGTQLAKTSLSRGESASPGETGADAWTFSEEETDRIFKKHFGERTVEDTDEGVSYDETADVSSAFRAGFQEGSYSLDEAMKRIVEDQNIQVTALAIGEQRLGFAEKSNNSLAASIGSTITSNVMELGGIPIIMYKGALGGDEAMRETYSDFIEQINADNTLIPNIKDEFITAINIYADPTSKVDNHMGFVRMAGQAYGLMLNNSQLEQSLINKGLAASNSDAAIMLQDENGEYYSEEYSNNIVFLSEYASIGIMPSDITVAEKAYITMQQYEQIQIGTMNLANKNAVDIAKMTGLTIDEISGEMTTLQPADFGGRMDKWSNIDNAYEDIFANKDGINWESTVETPALDESGLSVNLPSNLEDLTEQAKVTVSSKKEVSSLLRGGMSSKYGEGEADARGQKQIDKNNSLSGKYRQLAGILGVDLNSFYQNTSPAKDGDGTGYGGYYEHAAKGGSFDNYIPTADHIENMRDVIQRWVNDQLTVGSRSREGLAGGASTLFGSLPGTSLLVEGFELWPEKTTTEVAFNVADVKRMIATFEDYVDIWNKIQGELGRQKVSISKIQDVLRDK